MGSPLLFNGLTGALVELDDAESALARALLGEGAERGGALSDSLQEMGFLIPAEFNEVGELRRRAIDGRRARAGRLELVVSPTYSCNFRCTYCYVDPRSGTMSRETEDAIVHHIAGAIDSYDLVEVSWFGGEPLLCLDTVERVTRQLGTLAHDRGVTFRSYVTTNGYLLDAATAKRLEAVGVEYLHVTIDGGRETHDRLRVRIDGGPTYDAILANLLSAMESSEVLKFTLRSNVDHENISGVYDLMEAIPAEQRSRVQLSVTPIKGATVEPPDERLYAAIDAAVSRALELGYLYYPVSIPVGKPGFCVAEKEGNFHIGPDGRLYCCTPADSKPDSYVGRLQPDGTVEFVDGYAARYVGEPFSGQCRECEYLCFCMGGCPLERDTPKDESCRARFANIEALVRNLAESSSSVVPRSQTIS